MSGMTELARAIVGSGYKPRSSEHLATVLRRDSQGTYWVRIPGGAEETPITTPMVEAAEGDTVRVSISGGRSVMTGNVTSPVATGRSVKSVSLTAKSAKQTAEDALDASGIAAQAALDAVDSASTAASNATLAAGYAQEASGSAQEASGYAQEASGYASTAQGQAEIAAGHAQDAAGDAASAAASALSARNDAASAARDASAANYAANAALTELSIVEDVAGTLDWISKHGTYTQTSDTSVVDGKVYFEYDSTTHDYTPIVLPESGANPSSEGWYVLDVSDSQSDFIMAHLAVTARGLWVLPSGIGSNTTPASGESQTDSDARQASNYKLLLSSDGTYIYDALGAEVVKYGSTIMFNSNRGFAIGDTTGTSYIAFVPGQGVVIGGGVKIGSSKTLSEILAEIELAALSIEIQSSAGTSFINGTGSTTLTAKVYQYGDVELDSGGTLYSYKWYLNGTAISGATSKTYTASAPSATATYTCEVTL